MKHFEYLEPTTVAEACALLKQYDGEARVFAGGSSLTILLKQGFLEPKALINIKKIDELRRIEESPEGLLIGALVTHHDIETSSLLAGKLPVLCELEHDVANIRVRNMATVGGNIASGEPLTDLPCVFIALDASVRIAGAAGVRTVPLEEVFVDYYETQLKDDEVLTHVLIPPLPAHSAIEYLRFSSSSVVDKPCIGVAVRMSVAPDSGVCSAVRIGLGCVASTPLRARQAEALLEGRALNEERTEDAARAAAEECSPLSDLRGSERYKREMVRALVKRLALNVYQKAAAQPHDHTTT